VHSSSTTSARRSGERAKWRRPYRTCDQGAAEDSQERNPKVEKLALLEAHDKAMTNHGVRRALGADDDRTRRPWTRQTLPVNGVGHWKQSP
jgi:hypothetical protein